MSLKKKPIRPSKTPTPYCYQMPLGMELLAFDRTLKADYRKRLGFLPFERQSAVLGTAWPAGPFCNLIYFQTGKLQPETPASRRKDATIAAKRRQGILRGDYHPLEPIRKDVE